MPGAIMKKGDIEMDTLLIWIIVIATIIIGLVIIFLKGKDILGLEKVFDIFKGR